MNWTKDTKFNLSNVTEDMTLIYSPISVKLFQGNKELKKKGSFGGAKYEVTLDNGSTDTVVIKNNIMNGYTATFRGVQNILERKLSIIELIIGIAIPIIIMSLGCTMILFVSGVIGGALIGGIGALSILVSCNMVRQETSLPKQIIAALIASLVSYAIYFGLGIFIVSILGSIFSAFL